MKSSSFTTKEKQLKYYILMHLFARIFLMGERPYEGYMTLANFEKIPKNPNKQVTYFLYAFGSAEFNLHHFEPPLA